MSDQEGSSSGRNWIAEQEYYAEDTFGGVHATGRVYTGVSCCLLFNQISNQLVAWQVLQVSAAVRHMLSHHHQQQHAVEQVYVNYSSKQPLFGSFLETRNTPHAPPPPPRAQALSLGFPSCRS